MRDIKHPWTVEFSGKASKQKEKLPGEIKDNLAALLIDLKWNGPEQPSWRNYGKLLGKGKKQDIWHCHLNGGQPRYVAVWKVVDLAVQIMEIRYVGTHENADYRRIS
ncbi:MAG: type II toxin-antitoxin system RelE family toxin [Candidatus Adiutrix sp.]